jgi:hypothetical protein
MNYSFVISTGDRSISGSLNDTIYRNTPASYGLSEMFYDNSVITGKHASFVSLNSQILLEETSVRVSGKNINYDYIFTGDYFLTPDEASYFSSFRMADEISLSNSDSLIYDRREFSTGVAVLKQGISSVDSSITGLRLKVAASDPTITSVSLMFNNYYVFLNGQKIILNEYPSNSTTGKLFAIKKRQKTLDAESDYPDLYGSVLFIEDQVDYYINGMEQLESDFLQLYTGVTFVKTGVNCRIEFISYEENNYNL